MCSSKIVLLRALPTAQRAINEAKKPKWTLKRNVVDSGWKLEKARAKQRATLMTPAASIVIP